MTTLAQEVSVEDSENNTNDCNVQVNLVSETKNNNTMAESTLVATTATATATLPTNEYKQPSVYRPPSVKTPRIKHNRDRSPDSSQKIRGYHAGTTSPSAVYSSRRNSPVIKTTPDHCHALGKGRESIVFQKKIERVVSDETPSQHMTKPDRPHRSKSPESVFSTCEYLRLPPPLRLEAWSEPLGTSFSVRGHSYLKDSVKVDSLPSVFRLLTVDIVKVRKPMLGGICSHPQERIQMALQREQETGIRELPNFVFCINLVIPHTDTYHACFYFGLDDVNILTDESTSFGKVANRFFFGDSDVFRNETFKLIPRIVEGNFLVKKAVGSKPAILGKKIPQTYIRTSRYMEIVCNIAAEKVACGIVKLSLGYAKSLVVDMAFVLQGDKPSELPEQVLGAVRAQKLDFKKKDGKRVVVEAASR